MPPIFVSINQRTNHEMIDVTGITYRVLGLLESEHHLE